MPSLRDFRHRIRGVQDTRKITHAMELVAATKMRRATAAVLATRRYAQLAWSFLVEVRSGAEVAHHPLLEERYPRRRRLLLVVSGNRGLVGAFNRHIVSLALQTLQGSGEPTEVVVAGRVAARLLHRAGATIIADFPKKDILADPSDAAPIAEFLLQRFLTRQADQVGLIAADFLSTGRHEPRIRTLLPIGEPDKELHPVSGAGGGGPGAQPGTHHHSQAPDTPPKRSDLLFEPSPRSVLQTVVPNLLSIQVYQALLETTASEHAARMLAMQQATENAEELADELTLTLNQVRQQQITRDLQEIVSATLT